MRTHRPVDRRNGNRERPPATGAARPRGALLCAITWEERNGRRGGRFRPPAVQRAVQPDRTPRGLDTTMASSSPRASGLPEPPDAGVVFPVEGRARSTSATGRAVVADAVGAVDPALAGEALSTTDWRSGYLRPFREMTRLALVRPG